MWLDSDWQWSVVCQGFPHMQDGSEAWCHRTRLAAHPPWPVQNLFNVDHVTEIGWNQEDRWLGQWWVTDWQQLYWTMHQPTQMQPLHLVLVYLTMVKDWVQTGCLDGRRTKGWELIWEQSGNLSFNWIVDSSLAVASRRRKLAGWMLLSTGNHGSGDACNVP